MKLDQMAYDEDSERYQNDVYENQLLEKFDDI